MSKGTVEITVKVSDDKGVERFIAPMKWSELDYEDVLYIEDAAIGMLAELNNGALEHKKNK